MCCFERVVAHFFFFLHWHCFVRSLSVFACLLFTFFREASIFQDGGGVSDSKPLEGILSFGKGTEEMDPFEAAANMDEED